MANHGTPSRFALTNRRAPTQRSSSQDKFATLLIRDRFSNRCDLKNAKTSRFISLQPFAFISGGGVGGVKGGGEGSGIGGSERRELIPSTENENKDVLAKFCSSANLNKYFEIQGHEVARKVRTPAEEEEGNREGKMDTEGGREIEKEKKEPSMAGRERKTGKRYRELKTKLRGKIIRKTSRWEGV